MKTSSLKIAAAALAAATLVLAGCRNEGGSSASCQSPTLRASPDTVSPGDSVTITYVGLVECGEDAFFSGTVHLSIAEWRGWPTEPFSSPSPVVSGWAEISLPSGTPLPTPAPSVVAVVPDLKPGQYYVFLDEDFLTMTPSIAVMG